MLANDKLDGFHYYLMLINLVLEEPQVIAHMKSEMGKFRERRFI